MLDDKKLGGSIKNTSEVSRAKLKEAEWGMSLYFIDFSLWIVDPLVTFGHI